MTSFSSFVRSFVARLLVDPGDDRGGEVEDLLELLRSHVDQVADPARDALEEPDVGDGRGQVDVAHALAADLRAGDLDAAALADDALVADPLVLAAVALPVLGRTEDALAEEPVLLGLQRPVVDRLRLRDLAVAPAPDLLRGGEADLDCVEIVDVHACPVPPRPSPLRPSSCALAPLVVPPSPSATTCSSCSSAAPVAVLAVGADAGEVDAELLGGAQQLVVLLADLDRALVGDEVGVEREALDLLQQHLERLRDRRLGDVLGLDDRLVGLDAADGVVGLDGEHLLQRVGGAVGLERPDLHLAEALATELRLAAQRLLGDERVGAGRASVDLVVDEVQQLEDVHVADGDVALVRLAGAAVVELRLARRRGCPSRAALVDRRGRCRGRRSPPASGRAPRRRPRRVAPSKTGVAT